MLLANAARADYRGLVVRAQPSAIPAPAPRAQPAPSMPASITTSPAASITTPAPPAPLAAEVDPELESDGLDFDAEPEDVEPEDVDAEPDAEADFDADA